MRAKILFDLLFRLIVPSSAPRFEEEERQELVIRVAVLLFLALLLGSMVGALAPHKPESENKPPTAHVAA